jgi:hypothetical protein
LNPLADTAPWATDDAGDRARAQVIGFIRGAAGTPGAFTLDEIAALDARRTSKQHVAPYSNEQVQPAAQATS